MPRPLDDLRLALDRAGLLLRFLVSSVLYGQQRSVSRIEGRGGLLSLTGEDSEPGRVVSVELVVEEDAEVISDMNHMWVYTNIRPA